MESELRVHPGRIQDSIRRLRAWQGVWTERLEHARRVSIALIETVRAVPGQGFQAKTTTHHQHLGLVAERVERLARTLEQALERLETAFQEAAQPLREPFPSVAAGILPMAAVAASFEEAYAFIRRWEGGYVNDPDDRGGPTNLGITQATYDRYRQDHGLPTRDVRQITPEEAEAIYRRYYWEASGAARLPRPLGIVHMDTAVNMGGKRAMEFLTEAQRRYPNDPNAAVEAYLDLRLNRYLELARDPSQRKFLSGWLNRLRDLAGTATGSPEFQRVFEQKVITCLGSDPAFAEHLAYVRRHWGWENQERR